VQFEAFVPVLSGDRRCFVCIGSGMSSSFEVGSSRVLARQKRKSKTGGDEDEDEKDSNEEYDQNDAGNSRRPAKRATNPANGRTISLEAALDTSERLMQWGHRARLKQQQVANEQDDVTFVHPRLAQRLSKCQIAAAAERLSFQWRDASASRSGPDVAEPKDDDMRECTFRPQLVAKMESWVTCRYQYPPTIPRPRVIPR
ncbi:hypothetical protein DYB28_002668, partial [Aphanomyces astaci]